MLVTVDDDVGFAAFAGHSHRHQLFGEATRIMGSDRAVMGPHGQFVLLLAREPVLAAQILGGLDHPAVDRMRSTTRCFTGTVEAIH